LGSGTSPNATEFEAAPAATTIVSGSRVPRTPSTPHLRRDLTLRADIQETESTLQREFNKMKAITMSNMVEALGDGETKLLFLTGHQAQLLSQNESSIDKMFEIFGIGRPQLVINLLESGGFRAFTDTHGKHEWDSRISRWAPGVVQGRAPFLTEDDEMLAENRIDLFMKEVLIPLAAQTRAVVICCALRGWCVLSESFTRMSKLESAKWGGSPPYIVLSTTADMIGLYCTRDPRAYWRTVVGKSRTWQQEDARIRANVEQIYKERMPELHLDLDPHASNYIIVDEGVKYQGAYATLMNELVRKFGGDLPSLA